jgi:hypothetical protein
VRLPHGPQRRVFGAQRLLLRAVHVAARRPSGLCTTHRCIRLVYDTSMHQACVRHMDASGLCTKHGCIRLVYDTSMHQACVRHMDASGLCTTHGCIRLVYDTWMHQACVRHIDASGLCTTHRCIRLVYDTSMHQACVRHIDASGLCTTHRCIRLVYDTSMHQACVPDASFEGARRASRSCRGSRRRSGLWRWRCSRLRLRRRSRLWLRLRSNRNTRTHLCVNRPRRHDVATAPPVIRQTLACCVKKSCESEKWHGATENGPLNNRQTPNFCGVCVHASTGYTRVEGNRRVAKRLRELISHPKPSQFTTFAVGRVCTPAAASSLALTLARSLSLLGLRALPRAVGGAFTALLRPLGATRSPGALLQVQ